MAGGDAVAGDAAVGGLDGVDAEGGMAGEGEAVAGAGAGAKRWRWRFPARSDPASAANAAGAASMAARRASIRTGSLALGAIDEIDLNLQRKKSEKRLVC
jgi:hypothetical protein